MSNNNIAKEKFGEGMAYFVSQVWRTQQLRLESIYDDNMTMER